jgi:predicted nucleotidyltransferase
MNLNSLNDDFRDLLLALAEQGVEFLIVGAYALSFYGAPRASGDIDVFVRPSAANAARIWMALA